MSKLRLEELTYFHGKGTPYEIKALDGVDISIRQGAITGIIGHTGSGKSTLVQMFNGILKPERGRVLLDGEDIWKKPKNIRSVRFKVGLVMQYPEYQLFEDTVYKDIAFGPKNMGLDENQIKDRVEEAVRFAGLPSDVLFRSPFDLSGGQKRRVAIAGIIAMRPDVLVLDEPAAGLDPRGRNAIFGNIVDYQRESGSTVVIVSHSMEDMAKYCDDLVVMNDGKVCMEGNAEQIFSNAQKLTEIGLDVPQITKLMLRLKEMGLDVDTGVYTIESALESIMQIYKN